MKHFLHTIKQAAAEFGPLVLAIVFALIAISAAYSI